MLKNPTMHFRAVEKPQPEVEQSYDWVNWGATLPTLPTIPVTKSPFKLNSSSGLTSSSSPPPLLGAHPPAHLFIHPPRLQPAHAPAVIPSLFSYAKLSIYARVSIVDRHLFLAIPLLLPSGFPPTPLRDTFV